MNANQVKVGTKVIVTNNNGMFNKGEVVTITEKSESGVMAMNVSGRHLFKSFGNIELFTPALEAGFVIGQKYIVTGKRTHSGFSEGDVVTFIRDDGSDQPMFNRERDSYEQFAMLDALIPYVQTPCEQLGYKLGDKFIVVCDEGTFDKDSILTLTFDDGSDCPKFKTGVKEGYTLLARVTPYVEPATATELAGFAVGKKYVVVAGEGFHYFAMGSVIELVDGIEATMAGFKDANGKRQWLKPEQVVDFVEPVKTPMEADGYKLGDKFVLTMNSNFLKGEVVVFTRDDNSNIPFFTPVAGGRERCEGMFNLVPFVEPVLTPAEARGITVGTKVRTTQSTWSVEKGALLELKSDDGSNNPCFKILEGQMTVAESLFIDLSFVTTDLTITGVVPTTADGVTTIVMPELAADKLEAVLMLIEAPEVAEVVVPEPVAPAGFKQPYRITGNENSHGFETGDIVYIAQPFASYAEGMSKDPEATRHSTRGVVRHTDMEKVQAYKIVGNTSHHGFKTDDVVYEAGKQDGKSNKKPYADMSKNPAATQRDSAGGVYLTDRVAI